MVHTTLPHPCDHWVVSGDKDASETFPDLKNRGPWSPIRSTQPPEETHAEPKDLGFHLGRRWAASEAEKSHSSTWPGSSLRVTPPQPSLSAVGSAYVCISDLGCVYLFI